MKKRAFLVPVAVAASALAVTASASTIPTFQTPGSILHDAIADGQATSNFKVQTTPTRSDAFVLARTPEGTLLAQHVSHYSHDSHSSHSSHSSGAMNA